MVQIEIRSETIHLGRRTVNGLDERDRITYLYTLAHRLAIED